MNFLKTKKNLIGILFIFNFVCFGAWGANRGSATSLKLSVYKMAVSASPLCTNLITVVDNGESPLEVEFVGSVNIGSGTLASGTYPCVVVEFSDIIKYTPDFISDGGNCRTDTESQLDVCRDYNDNGQLDEGESSVLIDGTTSICSTGADRVAMYLSTASSSGNNSDAFNPPQSIGDAQRGFNLAEALTISGTSAGKFIVNPANKVCDGDDGDCNGEAGSCEMNPPSFSFSQIIN